MNKFLICGTGEDINNIDFNKIDKSFITAGVNRIYEKFIPDYFYIYDLKDIMPVSEDVNVIYTNPNKLYEYLNIKKDLKQHYCTYHDFNFTPTFKLNGKMYKCGYGSVNYLIRMLNNYLFKDQDNIFYIIGVPLLESVGHFFHGTGMTTQKVLDRFFNDFMRLKDIGYNIVSLMKQSRLNELFKQDDINLIYKEAA